MDMPGADVLLRDLATKAASLYRLHAQVRRRFLQTEAHVGYYFTPLVCIWIRSELLSTRTHTHTHFQQGSDEAGQFRLHTPSTGAS